MQAKPPPDVRANVHLLPLREIPPQEGDASIRKLKIEIDADLLSIPMNTLGDLFGYVSGVTAHLSNHGAPLAMHQPATPITDAYGHRVGSWLVVDGPHTTGEEPGNGIANLEAERLARAK